MRHLSLFIHGSRANRVHNNSQKPLFRRVLAAINEVTKMSIPYLTKGFHKTFSLSRYSNTTIPYLLYFLLLVSSNLEALSQTKTNQHKFKQPHSSKVLQKNPLTLSVEHPNPVVRVWRTNSKVPRATLICVHALGLSSHAYQDFAQKLNNQGFDIYAIDVRGFGQNRQITNLAKLDLNRTVGDIRILLNRIRTKNKQEKIFLIGESMGGAVVLKAASSYPDRISGALVSAPAFKLFKIRRLTIKGLSDLCLPGTGPAARSIMIQATSSQKLRNHWLQDNKEAHKLKLSIGEALSYYRFVRNTPQYSNEIRELPVCIIHGLQDQLAKPIGSAELFNKISSTNKTLVIDCAAEHLMLEENQLTARVQELTTNWLNSQLIKKPLQTIQSRHIIVLKEKRLSKQDQTVLNKIIDLSGMPHKTVEASMPSPLL